MNYGSIGYLSKCIKPESSKTHFEFAYRQEIFSAFCLRDDSKLHGLYYPCPVGKGYEDATLKHDFVITPIPPELWKVSAKLHVYLVNKPGTLNQLCAYLKRKRVSVVHSESSRSAYRYATWSLHVVFEELLGKKLHYDKTRSCYKETLNAVEVLILDFVRENKKYLFPLPEPVRGHPNYSLAFFKNHMELLPDSSPFKRPFTLKVHDPDWSHRKQRIEGDDVFNDIMNELQLIDPDLLPATTFSEIDTNDLNLRTVLIAKEDAKRFFKVRLKYRCIKKAEEKSDTYVGIIHSITEAMPPQYNIWHAYDCTIDNEPTESGQIAFLIENISKFLMLDAPQIQDIKDRFRQDFRDTFSYQQEAISHFEQFIETTNRSRDKKFSFNDLTIAPLPTPSVIEEIFLDDGKDMGFEYDLFISYSHNDMNNEALKKEQDPFMERLTKVLKSHGVVYHLDTEEIESGEHFDAALLDHIKKSREMCIVVSENIEKSEWMIIERGAAWILNKRIAIVVTANQFPKVPDHLRTTSVVNGEKEEKLHQYAQEIVARRNKYLGNKYRRSFSN